MNKIKRIEKPLGENLEVKEHYKDGEIFEWEIITSMKKLPNLILALHIEGIKFDGFKRRK